MREISRLEDLLAKVGVVVTMEYDRTGTRSFSRMESWRERVSDFRGCNAKTTGVKLSADRWSGVQIIAWELERTSKIRSSRFLTLRKIPNPAANRLAVLEAVWLRHSNIVSLKRSDGRRPLEGYGGKNTRLCANIVTFSQIFLSNALHLWTE